MTTWKRVQERREKLVADAVDELTAVEYELLEETLRIEADNRHKNIPHGVKDALHKTVERLIQ